MNLSLTHQLFLLPTSQSLDVLRHVLPVLRIGDLASIVTNIDSFYFKLIIPFPCCSLLALKKSAKNVCDFMRPITYS